MIVQRALLFSLHFRPESRTVFMLVCHPKASSIISITRRFYRRHEGSDLFSEVRLLLQPSDRAHLLLFLFFRQPKILSQATTEIE